MSTLTIAEYAKEVGTSKQAIYNWHNDGLIKFETELRAGNSTFVVNTEDYPFDTFKARHRGPKKKVLK